jgi:hypothetical protein
VTEALRAAESERDVLRARVEELVRQRDDLLAESAAGSAAAPDDAALRARVSELETELHQRSEDVMGACLARWEEEQDSARLRIAARNARQRAALLRGQGNAWFDWADTLAYKVAPVEVLGNHGEDGKFPWSDALDLITPAAEVDALRSRVAELEAAQAAVAELHLKRSDGDHCLYDGEPWPCPTLSALGAVAEPGPAVVPEPAPPLVVYRASHESIAMGRYTTVEAAREHCEADAHTDPDLTGVLNWLLDEPDEDDSAEELTVGGVATGYVVTPLTVADAYDPEADS